VAAPVTLICTHPTRGSKTLTLSEPYAEKLRARFEASGWTVVIAPQS
jgi:hypothetical protein